MYDKIIPEAVKAFTGALDKYLQQGAGTLEKFYMLAYKQNYFYAGADIVIFLFLAFIGTSLIKRGIEDGEDGAVICGSVLSTASIFLLYHGCYRLFCPEMAIVRDMLNMVQIYVK